MRFTNNRLLRTVSLLVVLAVLIATLGGCFPDRAGYDAVKQANAKAQAKAELAKLVKERSKPSTAEKLTDVTKDLQASLAKIAGSKAQDKAALRAAKTKLAILDKTIREEFQQTEAKITKLNAKIAIARQRKFVADYAAKMAKLNRDINDVIAADNKTFAGKAKLLSDYLATLIPEEKHQPLGSSLPHRNVDYNAGEPILGASIAPAYMATAPNLEPSTLPRTPTADDLAPTVDTSFTDAIKDLADKLDKDPVKMYEFVRNNIIYEPYYGSRKGAQETLWEKGGNDIDQANLLIALYRYSGIPARYVTGVVEIPIDRAMNWVGVEKPEVAAKVFSAAGIPSKAIIRGGKIDALQFEHTWVEGYVAYDEESLGFDESLGRKAWAALDASLKGMEHKAPIDAATIAEIEATDLTAAVGMSTATIENYVDRLSSYISTDTPHAKLGDVIGDKQIVKQELGRLPASLPSDVGIISVTREINQLNDNQRYRLKITGSGVDLERPLSDIAGQKLTIYYSASTIADANTIQEFGGLYTTPAYLVNLSPVIFLDGRPVDVGQPAQPGSEQAFEVKIIKPNGVGESIQKAVTVGASYVLSLNTGRVPYEVLAKAANELNDNIEGLETGPIEHDLLVSDLLSEIALNYFAQTDIAKNIAANLGGVIYTNEISAGFAEQSLDVAETFGVPTNIQGAGVSLDIKMDAFNVQAKDDDKQNAVAWAITTGMLSSGAEHNTFETILQTPAVSTARILEQARAANIPILTITSANGAISELQATAGVLGEVQNAIAAGRTVIIPKSVVTYHDWTGFGWVDLDPATGAAGYLISGGLAGGSTADASNISLNSLNLLLSTVAQWGQTILKVETVIINGVARVIVRSGVDGRFVSPALQGALKLLSNLIIPLVNAASQSWEDYGRTDLETWQLSERILLAFLAGVAASLLVTGAVAGAGLIFGALSPVILAGIIILVSALAMYLWGLFKEKIFEVFQSNGPLSFIKKDMSYA